MKALLSDRFSLAKKNVYHGLQPEQVLFVEKVKSKIQTGFNFVPLDCPCQKTKSKDDVVISEIDRYGLPLNFVLCESCGTIRIDPYLDKNSLSEFYTNYYQQMYGRSVDVEPYFEKQKNYGIKFHSLINLPVYANILEFGCGAGGALEIFRSHGANVYGVEYSEKLIAYGKSKGLKNLFYGSLQEFRIANPSVKFDLIYSNHVFEHIAEPQNYLSTCVEILNPTGVIICAIPDVYNSHQYIFPNSDLRSMLHIAHVFNYSFKCLEKMAEDMNMKITRIFPSPIIRTATSDMPEIWFQISKTSDIDQLGTHKHPLGNFLQYLQNTENNFNNKINLLQTDRSVGAKIKTILKRIIQWKK